MYKKNLNVKFKPHLQKELKCIVFTCVMREYTRRLHLNALKKYFLLGN